MQLVEGKYNQAKVFTDVVEEGALKQIQMLCDQEFTKDSKIRIMPDVHAGAGCTIGTTMTIKDIPCTEKRSILLHTVPLNVFCLRDSDIYFFISFNLGEDWSLNKIIP